ncbi:MAG: patatin-like phospholipase family protein [Rhodoplanes sp.]|uniref:patatin-like phospholipase family protein n=1 Tax=Rhodoplanes sp. TaxID=1968906 RepID=UPI001825DD47|nr:patatin-like phospholipase family protein [Rhodoplanes sp.]NVO15093.1 patatin-like phospholipase family protein [Rhodoplanes sp.]
MPTKPEFQIGLVMAGAISAGAYTAGVMDFFVEALDAYYAARSSPDWTGPTHDVRIPVMAGSSAGGMTAAIAALHAFHDLVAAQPAAAPPPKPANRLYSSWVTDISIERLLETTDLDDPTAHVRSLLCSDVLLRIVQDAFDLQGAPRQRDWIGCGADRSLRVMLTATNMRGVPYSFPVFGSGRKDLYGTLNHGDYLDFSIGMPGRPADGVHALDIRDTSTPEWSLFKTAALATGAFPFGLAPRRIDRAPTDYRYAQLVGFDDPASRCFKTIGPDAAVLEEASYPFVAVDGGTINNEPLEIARRHLANQGRNDQDGKSALRAVVLVAPFPNFVHLPEKDDNDSLIHVGPRLLSTLIAQARFKPDELAKAADDKIFSRFMISPIRPSAGNRDAEKYPIASGVLDGFGGFLHESFRRHDYLLGRRNAQAFLRWSFALPDTNPLFAEYHASAAWERRDAWHVRDVVRATHSVLRSEEKDYNKKQYAEAVNGPEDKDGLPIIPLTDAMTRPIDIKDGDLPKPLGARRDAIEKLIDTRTSTVVGRMIDLDLLPLTDGMFLGGALRWAAHRYASELASRKAKSIVRSALESVGKAFP